MNIRIRSSFEPLDMFFSKWHCVEVRLYCIRMFLLVTQNISNPNEDPWYLIIDPFWIVGIAVVANNINTIRIISLLCSTRVHVQRYYRMHIEWKWISPCIPKICQSQLLHPALGTCIVAPGLPHSSVIAFFARAVIASSIIDDDVIRAKPNLLLFTLTSFHYFAWSIIFSKQ